MVRLGKMQLKAVFKIHTKNIRHRLKVKGRSKTYKVNTNKKCW